MVEVAVVEVLRDWPGPVEADWAEMLGIISTLVSDDAIEVTKIIANVAKERHVALREHWSVVLASFSRAAQHQEPRIN